MKIKVGDKVRIKSLEWYNKNKNINNTINIGPLFAKNMAYHCGKTYTIKRVFNDSGWFILNECGYTWCRDFVDSDIKQQKEFDFV